MVVDGIAGSRIRERRIDKGIRQATLAATLGISAPYLNLIEHNRRRIAGDLLAQAAAALDVPVDQLSSGVDVSLLDQLRSAAADMAITAETVRAEDLAVRFPGWSDLIVHQAARIASLQDRVQVLTDRMTYDPELAGSLHQVITAVTAVRSAASILVGGETIDADWQARFHRNIYDDSVRLAASSEALIRYLDTPDAEGPSHMAPIDEVEAALDAYGSHIPDLEAGQSKPLDRVLSEMAMSSPMALDLMSRFLHQYAADAAAMPLPAFADAARTNGHDPAALVRAFAVPFEAVLRRLASLPVGEDHPAMGLAVADASGALVLNKQVRGFALPRAGAGCPLWPVFTAFARPDQPLRVPVVLPDTIAQRFLCYAIAVPIGQASFDAPPILRSTMLVIPDAADDGAAATQAGVSCRICPRADCVARREQSTMTASAL